MKNKYILFLYFFFLIHLKFHSQTRTVDSLKLLLKDVKLADSTKAKTLVALAWEIKYDNVNEAEHIAKEGIELSKKTNRLKDIATGLKIMGIINDETFHYKESIDYYLKSINYFEKLKDTISISRVECNIGMLYRKMDQNMEAIKYFKKCLPIFEKAEFVPGINLANQNTGICYFNLRKFDIALEYFLKAMDVITKYKMTDPSVYGNVGNCYFAKNDFVKAEKYILICNQQFKEAGDSSLHFYFWKFALANVYLELNRVPEAIKLLEESKEGYQKLGLFYSDGHSKTLAQLGKSYSKAKNFAKAYENILNAYSINDTLFNKDFAAQMNEMKEKYEADKNELSISNLNKEAQLKDAQIDQQRFRQYGMTAGLILLLVLSFVLYKNFTQKKKDNTIIQHQKNIVDGKNKEITDSITYAKRIQTASLPTENYIQKNMERLKKQG